MNVMTVNNAEPFLKRTSLIREIYRSLINNGRTYAGFTSEEKDIVQQLAGSDEILDPMSGYGGLLTFCSEIGIKSYNLEYNPPQYFWQLLKHPKYAVQHYDIVNKLLDSYRHWPISKLVAITSNDFFPEESFRLIMRLLIITEDIAKVLQNQEIKPLDSAMAILLPFISRLACNSPGDISTHIKQGGVCVYKGWNDDFRMYLKSIMAILDKVKKRSKCNQHTIVLGDARNFEFPRKHFKKFITSPPYPNHRDFSSIFNLENEFLKYLDSIGVWQKITDDKNIVGSNFTKEKAIGEPKSVHAVTFIETLTNVKRTRQAIYDDEAYYFPYLKQYFIALEVAYENVSKALSEHVEGYVIVVNNTHRGIVIPVSTVIMELWQKLGFSAKIVRAIESFHVGTKNPRAKGIRARHTEYMIKVWR
jgi:hypothetical protein